MVLMLYFWQDNLATNLFRGAICFEFSSGATISKMWEGARSNEVGRRCFGVDRWTWKALVCSNPFEPCGCKNFGTSHLSIIKSKKWWSNSLIGQSFISLSFCAVKFLWDFIGIFECLCWFRAFLNCLCLLVSGKTERKGSLVVASLNVHTRASY